MERRPAALYGRASGGGKKRRIARGPKSARFDPDTMRIDVISDTVCPWCFIGKRRLERALARRPALEPTVIWHPFQLNPDMPEGGRERREYLRSKFGGAEAAARIYAAIGAAGADLGIDFDFDAIAVTPNTVDSHRLIRWAGDEGKQDAMVETLFRGYFIDGADIGDRRVLAAAAAGCGMDGAAIGARLAGDSDRAAVVSAAARASAQGVSGVPCFIVEGKYVVSGAQDPDRFVTLFDALAAA